MRRVAYYQEIDKRQLDRDGTLMIGHPSPQGFQISAQAPLLTSLSWTPPVVGTRLYVRDRRTMVALDLS